MDSLSSFKCVPCSSEVPPLEEQEIQKYLREVPNWKVVKIEGVPRLENTYTFKNFREALDFTNQVGEVAEEEGHHPAILCEWGKVTVSWWTHKIRGLHPNDFIMAAKTDQLYQSRQQKVTASA